MSTESLDRLRALALAGLVEPERPTPLVPRRRRASGEAPEIPDGATVLAREPMPEVLRVDAERHWKLCARPWTPSLAWLHERPIERVEVRGRDVTVVLRNATHCTRALPPAWIPVIVAMLVDDELTTVRRALREGAREFRRTR